MMNCLKEELNEDDLCFAHVKSFPWWPARISSKSLKKSRKGGQLVFSVIFFGTEETAILPEKELVSVSAESIRRCVTKGSLRRKFYKEAYEELIRRGELLLEHHNDQRDEGNEKGEEDKEHEVNSFPSQQTQSEFLALFSLMKSIPQPPELSDNPVEVQRNKPVEDEDVFEDIFDEAESRKTSRSQVTFRSQALLDKQCTLNRADDEDSDGIFIDNVDNISKKCPQEVEATSESCLTAVTGGKAVRKKKAKQKKSPSKLVKSLQEDEVEANKLFAEKIVMKEDFYFCKFCKFSSSAKMRARSHAGTCGKLKKKGRAAKESKCLQCFQRFSSKKELLKHNREHLAPYYTCSNCLKTFSRHHSYLRHLKSHNEPPNLKCSFGSCGKIFRYRSDLTRHLKTHSKAPVAVFETASEPSDEVIFQVELDEKRICGNYSGKLSYTELGNQKSKYQKNCTSFDSSLELKNIEDWDVYVDLSHRFEIPLSSFKPSGSAESCVFTNTRGETTCQYAWNTFQSPDEMATEIVDEVVEAVVAVFQSPGEIAAEIVEEVMEEVVAASILQDPNATNDEAAEIIFATLQELMAKYATVGVLDQALFPLDKTEMKNGEGAGLVEDTAMRPEVVEQDGRGQIECVEDEVAVRKEICGDRVPLEEVDDSGVKTATVNKVDTKDQKGQAYVSG